VKERNDRSLGNVARGYNDYLDASGNLSKDGVREDYTDFDLQ
jgi:hypothetical protein